MYDAPSAERRTTMPTPDLMARLSSVMALEAAWLPFPAVTTHQAQLLRELAAMSVDPDRALDQEIGIDIWGLRDE